MNRKNSRFLLLGLIVFSLFAVSLEAQLNRGVIDGTVTDPEGRVVPRVQVTITDTGTDVSISAKTNDAGYYRAADLVPGQYALYFEALGFTPLDLTNIQVPAGEEIRQNVQLKIGTTKQAIQVRASPLAIQTAPTNFSTTLNSNIVNSVPLEGRDVQELVLLIPGVIGNGPAGSSFGFNSEFGTFPDPTHVQGSDVAVNGGQGGENAWYLDGSLNLSPMAENVAINPSPDAVGEFQAITNAFSAKYGRTGGSVFNVVLKSGANQVHGDVYEYDRNSYFNARNPFTSINSFGQIIPQDVLRYNDFGGTVGGPVVLPHIYDGKDKTFFFFSWDTALLHLSGNDVFTVPSPAMRNGDFSEDPDTAEYGIWNPYSTVGPNSSGIFQRTAFGTPVPGNPYGPNGCTNTAVESGGKTCNFSAQLPPSMLDPTARFFINSFPMPNYLDPLSNAPLTNGGQYRIADNYLGPVGSLQDDDNISLKLDHVVSDKSRFFGEWLYNPYTYTNYMLPWTGPTFPSVGFGSQLPFNETNQIISIGHTYSFSPTAVNQVHISWTRQFLTTHPSTGGYPASVTDLPQVQKELAPDNIPLFPPTPDPSWSVSTPGGGSMSFGQTEWVSNVTASDALTIEDDLTKVIGKHTIQTGFMYLLDHEGTFQSAPTYLNFTGNGVVNPTTGLGGGGGLAQFELGAVMNNLGSAAATAAWRPYLSWPYYGTYIQDDYQIKPRLTLNFGLRYDIFQPWTSRQKPESRFCLGCLNPDTGLLGEVQYSGEPGFPAGSPVVGTNYNDLGPRMNFSWSPFPNNKTVIRGGYDVFYSNAYDILTMAQSALNAPGYAYDNYWEGSANPSQCAPLSGGCVAWPLTSSIAKAPLSTPPVTFSFPAQAHSPLYTTYMKPVFKPPHDPNMQTWTFEVERQLRGGMGLTVGYTGSHGTFLPGDAYNYGHTPEADVLNYREAIDSVVPITNYYSGKPAAALAQAWGESSLPLSTLLSPYPLWPGLDSAATFAGNISYNALDVVLQSRMSHGLQWNLSYTWSKDMANPFANSQPAGFLIEPVAFARPGYSGGATGVLGYNGAFNSLYQNPNNIFQDDSISTNDIPQVLSISAVDHLPFGTDGRFLANDGILSKILGHWSLSGIFDAEDGLPVEITGPCDGVTCRPNLVGNPQAVPGGRSINQWLNSSAWEPVFGNNQAFWANPNVSANNWWEFGTSGPFVDTIRMPGFWNIDASLVRDFHIAESKYFEFEWDVFNALNHQNPGTPDTNWCLPPGPNGQTNLVQQAGCQFGRITNVQTDPRALQFALKFHW
jgi:hypothetical protein